MTAMIENLRNLNSLVDDPPTLSDELLAEIANRRISDLVKHAPDALTILSTYGLGFCCDGGHLLGAAMY